MEGQYEVLSPWAEADPVPLLGLAPRLCDLNYKKIGLFRNSKIAARPTLTVVKARLEERFPTVEFIDFDREWGGDLDNPENSLRGNRNPDTAEVLEKFEEWAKGVDAIVGAIGD